MAAEGGASLPAISWTKQDLYNRTGRGYPDVSGQGSRYAIAWQQTFLNGESPFSSFCPGRESLPI